jgi:hypothetical protein
MVNLMKYREVADYGGVDGTVTGWSGPTPASQRS